MLQQFVRALTFSFILSVLFFLALIIVKDTIEIESHLMFNVSIILFFTVLLLMMLYFWIFYQLRPHTKQNKEHEIAALKTAEKYRREFFGNVSHELKTPIFNIQGYIETLIGGAMYDKNVNKKYLKRTSKSVERLIYIIQDLESISQLESEELLLDFKEWNLKTLINDIVEQFEIKSKQKKVKLIHDKKSTNFVVRADKGKISQVLYNLISNSIKYGKKNGITKISCHQSKSKCFISVQDDGIGIAEKNIKRLFERFYRVDKSRSREQGGTGLGLAIVKHIIEAHNQEIVVKSTLKKGTEFIFSMDCVNSPR